MKAIKYLKKSLSIVITFCLIFTTIGCAGDAGGGGPASSINPPASEDDIDDGLIYSITDIKETSGQLQFEVSSGKDSYLEVEILSDVSSDIVAKLTTDWASGSVITTGRTQVPGGTEKEFVNMTLSGSLPETFVVVAQLVDGAGKKMCDQALFIYFTESYAKYMSKTANDSSSESAIDLDDDPANHSIKIILDDFDDFVGYLDLSEADEGVEYLGPADLLDFDALSQEIYDSIANQGSQ